MDDLRDIAFKDQEDAAWRDTRELFDGLTEMMGGEILEGGMPDWFPEQIYCGCPHANSPRPVFAFWGEPEVVYCSACSSVIALGMMFNTGCDRCGEENVPLTFAASSGGAMTIAGVLCPRCFDEVRP